ncbi:radical SAM protein [Agathobaculum sp. NTUH-O15-33]|uniref:SPL family radical SAM protein n=1 Tax=Agathobaculum sp. NTUH-O15-33 TaxID=3079302 RepID=UPI002958A567|nr:radical SAM protein [Agathobaculum sp. NTUH-O15-33]WNX83191.1 radical SAM protein [Agathobaculum sp. NTUH-O15-33]
MTIREVQCAAACRRLKRDFPYRWDLNPYRGCAHRCQYCFAVYSHKYLESASFYDEIFVKTNIVQRLEYQLSRPDWPREVVNIGGITDSYQPAEAKYRLMPDILRLLIRYRTPCIISTKSDLILRDFDLIDELSRKSFVIIASTITTVDEDLRRVLEPGGASSARRFEMLRAFSRTKACTGLHIMPIIPYLTDGRDNLEGLAAAGKAAGVQYVQAATLYLRGGTRQVFFDFIRRERPALAEKLRLLYAPGADRKAYKDSLYQMFSAVKKKHGLTDDYAAIMRDRLPRESEQLSLF